MNKELPRGRAICYSGYREDQRPGHAYPSLDQIREDLRILQPHWRLLRLYDCTPHAERVLEVIRRDGLDFQVMLGAYLGAEVNNPGCPWGATYSDEALAASRAENDAEVGRLIALAKANEDIVFSVAVGNEATVDWTDHLVPVPRMIEHVRRVRQAVRQPVTFCENYVPWQNHLRDLVPELDFISLHTYPVWEYKQLHEALDYTRQNYDSVAHRYPGQAVVITEAGWTTRSNGRGIDPDNTSQELQAVYLRELIDVDRRRRHPVLRLRGLRRTLEGLARPAGAREALGPVHRRPPAQAGDVGLACAATAGNLTTCP